MLIFIRNFEGIPTQDDLIGLIWLFYYKVASYNELFTSGVIRIGTAGFSFFFGFELIQCSLVLTF